MQCTGTSSAELENLHSEVASRHRQQLLIIRREPANITLSPNRSHTNSSIYYSNYYNRPHNVPYRSFATGASNWGTRQSPYCPSTFRRSPCTERNISVPFWSPPTITDWLKLVISRYHIDSLKIKNQLPQFTWSLRREKCNWPRMHPRGRQCSHRLVCLVDRPGTRLLSLFVPIPQNYLNKESRENDWPFLLNKYKVFIKLKRTTHITYISAW